MGITKLNILNIHITITKVLIERVKTSDIDPTKEIKSLREGARTSFIAHKKNFCC